MGSVPVSAVGRSIPCARVGCIAACCWFALIPESRGQTYLKATGSGSYQYDSNVFDVPGGQPVPGTRDFRHEDSYYTYGGEFDVDHSWSQQDWYAAVIDTEYKYDHFTQLTHNEYRLKGGWKWRLGPRLNGTLEVARDHVMVPFTQVEQSQIVTNTDQREAGSIDYRLAQYWSIEGSGFTHSELEPLADAPQLRLKESQGAATLRYFGSAAVTWGISASYLHGAYSNASDFAVSPSYDQKNAAVLVDYAYSGRTTLDAIAGYSKRDSAAQNNTTAGFTAHLAFTDHLTGKTSLVVALDRTINSYLTNAGSEFDNSASLKINWQATYKLGIAAGYVWTYSEFPHQGIVPGTNRLDHLQYPSLYVDYEWRPWLALKPYANIQTRSSDYPGFSFNATSYGILLVYQWQQGKQPGP